MENDDAEEGDGQRSDSGGAPLTLLTDLIVSVRLASDRQHVQLRRSEQHMLIELCANYDFSLF